MKKKQVLSLVLALVMMVGVFAPAVARAEDGDASQSTPIKKEDVLGNITEDDIAVTIDKEFKTKLTIHKLVADGYKNGVPVDHNGGKLTDAQIQKLGTNVKGLEGVTFTYYKVGDQTKFETMLGESSSYQTEDAVKKHLGVEAATGSITTGADGSISVDLAEGNYWFIETDRPSGVTEAKAVPFGITLPLMNQGEVKNKEGKVVHEAGTVYMKNVHVYPKNVSKRPEMDKYYGNALKETDSSNLTGTHKLHPDYARYLEKKAEIDARIGSKVPYEVKTKLKQGQVYKTLSWSDIMTDGLKFDSGSFIMTVDGEIFTGFDLQEFDNGMGFDVIINDASKINELLESKDVEVVLRYTATVTKEAVVDSPESNNIVFNPGKPNHNEHSTNPTVGNIKVNKSWADKTVPNGVLITYNLIDHTEKKVVATVTLNTKEAGTSENENILSKSLNEGITVTNKGNYEVVFGGLDDNHKYSVEEFADGYKPEYTNGNTIVNKISPDSIHPTPPQVVVGGKKFVKTNDKNGEDLKRLAGAEFVIYRLIGDKSNQTKEYLAARTEAQNAAALELVTTAKANLDEAIKVYNNLTAEDQKNVDEKKKVNDAQEAYNKAVKEASDKYDWDADIKNAITLVSDAQGRFEIKGLAYGTYYLEETKAPAGYAKLTKAKEFTVSKESYKENSGDIDYELNSNKDDALKVENKDLTIPQTGGIGTAIFAVTGVALMGGAVVAMRRGNKEEEEI